jgi:hypothetical protein
LKFEASQPRNWKIEKVAGAKAVHLWDAPDRNWFVFDVENSVLESPNSLEAFLKSTMLLEKSPLGITDIFLQLADAPIAGVAGKGIVSFSQWRATANGPGFAFDILLYRGDKTSRIMFVVGKNLLGGYPEETMWLKQRFPTLSALIKSRSTDQLIADLEFSATDPIIVKELVLRDLSPEEFRELMLVGKLKAKYANLTQDQKISRMRVVMATISHEKRTEAYDPELHSAIRFYSKVDGQAGSFTTNFLFAAQYLKTADFSLEALDLLKQKHTIPQALRYLSNCGRTQEVYTGLKSISLPQDSERLKANALRWIDNRIDHRQTHCE